MRVQVTAFEPKDYSIDSRGAAGKLTARLCVELLHANVHNIDDEQLACIWSMGMIEDILLITGRDKEKPFASVRVHIPGFDISYFWSYESADPMDGRHVVVAQMAAALHAQGEGDLDELVERIERLAR